jgi:hypothetical protein
MLLACNPGSIHLGAWPTRKGFPKTIKTDFINGDDLVPLQSSLRGEIWGAEMDKLGKRLVHKGYFNQPHANCFPGIATGVGDVFFVTVTLCILSLSLCEFCHCHSVYYVTVTVCILSCCAISSHDAPSARRMYRQLA